MVALGPQEIQVGLLKRLRGTPIIRHDREWAMVYSPHPPYEILQTKLIDFFTMQRLRRLARYWDLIANSGNFVETTPLFWRDPLTLTLSPHAGRGEIRDPPLPLGERIEVRGSPFWSFLHFSDWLYAQTRQTHSIALARLRELVARYLTEEAGVAREEVQRALHLDSGRSRISSVVEAPPRQARHLTPHPSQADGQIRLGP